LDSHGSRSDHEARDITPAAVILLATLSSACQAYAPAPPDLDAHRAAWHARTAAAASLPAFLERLAALDPPAATAGFDATDGLTVGEGRLIALAFHPDLRLARLRAGHAAASAELAGLRPDPTLAADALWIDESVPERWVVSAGLTFAIPLGDRLDAERGVAAAELDAAELRVREAEWTVVHDVERAWIAWSAARLRVAETERLLGALESLVTTAARLAERGEMPRSEASLFAVEAALRANRLRGLRGEAEAAEQALRAAIGMPPDAPLDLVPSLAGTAHGDAPPPEALAARNLTLARLRAEHAVAEEALRLAIEAQVPDLALGPQLASDEGQSRIGLLGGIPLPLWNANRRAIAEARARRELARAALETELEVLSGRRAVASARAAALTEQRAELESVVVPLVERQAEDALRLVRLGEGSSLVLLESLRRAHETKLELVDAWTAAVRARVEIDELTGPPPAAEMEPAP
jgi:outer membrane protein TolC